MLGPKLIDVGNPVADHPLNRRDRLVSWWTTLPNTVGSYTLRDLMCRWHGTWAGVPKYTLGPDGLPAFQMTQHSAYVTAGDLTDVEGGSQITVSVAAMWRSLTASNPGLFSKTTSGTDIDLIYLSGTSMFCRVGADANYGTSATIVTGRWQHWTMVFDGTGATNADRLKLYLDGQQVTLTYVGTIGTTVPANAVAANIGRYSQTNAVADAIISDVRVYKTALSASDCFTLADQWRRGRPDLLRRYTPSVPRFTVTPVAATGNRRRRAIICGSGI